MRFIMSVCMSAQNNSLPTGRIFIKFVLGDVFLKICRKNSSFFQRRTHIIDLLTKLLLKWNLAMLLLLLITVVNLYNSLSVELPYIVKLNVLTERNETQLQTRNNRNAFQHRGLQYSCTLLLLKMEAECFFET